MSAWCRFCNAPAPPDRICGPCGERLDAGETVEPRELSLLELVAERHGLLVIMNGPER